MLIKNQNKSSVTFIVKQKPNYATILEEKNPHVFEKQKTKFKRVTSLVYFQTQFVFDEKTIRK